MWRVTELFLAAPLFYCIAVIMPLVLLIAPRALFIPYLLVHCRQREMAGRHKCGLIQVSFL